MDSRTLKRHEKADERKYSRNAFDSAPKHEASVFDSGIAIQQLFDGSDETVLIAITRELVKFSSTTGMSKRALNANLKQQHDMLPKPNNMPETYEHALAMAEPYMIPLVTYDACINDCILFRDYSEVKAYSTLDKCPICEEDRFHKSKARKSYSYMPIVPRLKRWFAESNLAKLVQMGPLDIDVKKDILQTFKDSPEFAKWFMQDGVFYAHRYNDSGIPLSLFTDGLNPNRNNGIKRSIWPLGCTWLSLDPALATTLGPMMIVGIVPGKGAQEPKSLDPYVELLVDELLSETDKITFNAYLNAPVALKVRILHYQCDLPALSKLLHLPGPMASKCSFCNHRGTYSSFLHKTVHGNNARFLPMDHPARETCEDEIPQKKSKQEDEMLRLEFDRLPNEARKQAFRKEHGVRGVHPLMKQESFDTPRQISPDGMHTCVDLCDNIMNLVLGKTDTASSRTHDQQAGRFQAFFDPPRQNNIQSPPPKNPQPPAKKPRKRKQPTSHNSTETQTPKRRELNVNKLSKAPWCLTKAELKQADLKAATLLIPAHYDLPNGPYFETSSLKKMHSKKKVTLL